MQRLCETNSIWKLGAMLNNCKFVEYIKEFIGYYFYHLVEQKMFVSKYATFLEK